MNLLRLFKPTRHYIATNSWVEHDREIPIVWTMICHSRMFGVERVDHIKMRVEGYLICFGPRCVYGPRWYELSVRWVGHRHDCRVLVSLSVRGVFWGWIALNLFWLRCLGFPNYHVCVLHSGTKATSEIRPSLHNAVKNDAVGANIVVDGSAAAIRDRQHTRGGLNYLKLNNIFNSPLIVRRD